MSAFNLIIGYNTEYYCRILDQKAAKTNAELYPQLYAPRNGYERRRVHRKILKPQAKRNFKTKRTTILSWDKLTPLQKLQTALQFRFFGIETIYEFVRNIKKKNQLSKN